MDYQDWKELIARPSVVERDGNKCQCVGGCWRIGTDLDHIRNKGSRPDLKKDISNLQLLCRICHNNKTDLIICIH
jgi:5-methylcytosine-specific restriction endonuclease McrA